MPATQAVVEYQAMLVPGPGRGGLLLLRRVQLARLTPAGGLQTRVQLARAAGQVLDSAVHNVHTCNTVHYLSGPAGCEAEQVEGGLQLRKRPGLAEPE